MENYPWFNNIDIKMVLRPHVTYDIQLSYIVIDPDRIISCPSDEYSKNILYIYLPQSREYKQKFHIQIDKIYIICMTVNNKNNESYEIYDGPDDLSDPIKSNNLSLYVTSMFQCIIKISSHLYLNRSNAILKYFSKINKISVNLNILDFKYVLINYPTGESSPLSIVTISSKLNHHLNISITNFTNNCTNNTLCTYACISFYEVSGDTYVEKRSICTDEGDFYKHRHIYSNQSKILVVMYAYKRYGMMHMSMKIAATKCKLTKMNVYLCAYDFYCSKYIRQNLDLCKRLIRGSDVKANFDARYFAGKLIHHKEEGCIIFQFTQEVNLFVYKVTTFVNTPNYCGVYFKPVFPKLFSRKSTFHVMGFFTGKYGK